VRLEHVLVWNRGAGLPAPSAPPPCALLVVGDRLDARAAWQGRAFVEAWRSGPVRVFAPLPVGAVPRAAVTVRRA
jgi:hypothetical protein